MRVVNWLEMPGILKMFYSKIAKIFGKWVKSSLRRVCLLSPYLCLFVFVFAEHFCLAKGIYYIITKEGNSRSSTSMTNFHFASGKSCNKLATAKIISLLVESQNTQLEKKIKSCKEKKKRKAKGKASDDYLSARTVSQHFWPGAANLGVKQLPGLSKVLREMRET